MDSVSTSGLRWNISGQRMEWGGLVSTSNEIDGEVVEVSTSHTLLWTCSLAKANNGPR